MLGDESTVFFQFWFRKTSNWINQNVFAFSSERTLPLLGSLDRNVKENSSERCLLRWTFPASSTRSAAIAASTQLGTYQNNCFDSQDSESCLDIRCICGKQLIVCLAGPLARVLWIPKVRLFYTSNISIILQTVQASNVWIVSCEVAWVRKVWGFSQISICFAICIWSQAHLFRWP